MTRGLIKEKQYRTDRITNIQEENLYKESIIKDIFVEEFPEPENDKLEAQRVPAKKDLNKNSPMHILIRMMKTINRARIFKALILIGNCLERKSILL